MSPISHLFWIYTVQLLEIAFLSPLHSRLSQIILKLYYGLPLWLNLYFFGMMLIGFANNLSLRLHYYLNIPKYDHRPFQPYYAAMKPYIDIADQTKINAIAKFNML